MYCDLETLYILGLIGSFLMFHDKIYKEKRHEKDKHSINPIVEKLVNDTPQEISIMDRPMWYFLVKYFIGWPALIGFCAFLLIFFFRQE